MKTPALLNHTLISWIALLSGLVHNWPALGDSCSAPSFVAARTFDAGQNPGTVATGDFNSDGKPDLAVVNVGSWSVLLGHGDGTFQSPITQVLPSGAASSLAIGDFNGDGRSDLAVTVLMYIRSSPIRGSVRVFLGRGDRNFETSSVNNVGINPISVAVGDFNRDGKSDLVVVANLFGFGDISVLLGKGDGKFQDAVSFNYPSAGGPTFATVSDFNGDDKPDLAITDSGSATNNYSGASVSVLLGNGDGTFQSAVGYAVGRNPGFVTVGDFNNDGKPDLVAANSVSDNISVLLGNGDGTFQNALNYSTGAKPLSVATGDLSGDGKPDLVVGSQYGVVSVLLAKGDGTFQNAALYSASLAGSVVLGDFNGDGKLDVATPGSMIFGDGDGTLEAAPSYSVGSNPSSVAVGDFNGDGQPDLATANFAASDSVSVLLGQRDGIFQAAIPYAAGSYANSVAVGDFNGDNKPDLVVANSGVSNNVSVLLGQGDGTFLPAVQFSAGTNPSFVSVGDFDGDAKPDLAVANSGGSLSLLLGNGDGTFRPTERFVTLEGSPNSVAVGDFNGDGNWDLAVTVGFTPFVSVVLGNGDGTFGNAVTYYADLRAQSVAVGDFNGDEKPDLAVYSDGAGPVPTVSVLLSKGDGTFRSAINAHLPTNREIVRPGRLALADFNGDGKLDVTVGEKGGTVSLLLGNGDGTFQKIVSFGVGGTGPPSPVYWPLAVGDFNSDNKPDLVGPSTYGVTVLLNTCGSSGAGLSALRINATATISWPLSSTGAVLESTTSLSLTNWQSVVETPRTNNGRLEISMPPDQTERYFRLRQQ